jgi:hypothetical protein
MKQTILDDELKSSKFEVYDKFPAQEDARYLVSLLKKHNILFEVEKPKQLVDTAIGGDAPIPKVFVKIFPQDFKRVNKLIEDDTLRLIEEGKMDIKGHFLHDFTDEELLDVLRKPDEWNFDTTAIARYLLKSRGVEFSEQQMNEIKAKRIAEVRRPKPGNRIWIVALFILGLAGGFYWHVLSLIIAFPMAYYYWTDTSLDPNGQRFYTFDKQTRQFGKIIFYLTTLALLARVAMIFLT